MSQEDFRSPVKARAECLNADTARCHSPAVPEATPPPPPGPTTGRLTRLGRAPKPKCGRNSCREVRLPGAGVPCFSAPRQHGGRGWGLSSLQSRTQEEKWDAQDTGFREGRRETAQAGDRGGDGCRSTCMGTISPPAPGVSDHGGVSLVASETMRTTQRITSEHSCQQPAEGSAAGHRLGSAGCRGPSTWRGVDTGGASATQATFSFWLLKTAFP